MGMFREPGSTEIDVIKEMAESLGSTGYSPGRTCGESCCDAAKHRSGLGGITE